MDRIAGVLRGGDDDDGGEYALQTNIHAGIVAGDMNAIEPFDQGLPAENGMKDVFLQFGGVEGAENGWKWGIQCPTGVRERCGPCRMELMLSRWRT